ncbi:MAG: AAA family ATPase, partial [Gammaproteobacteria bacterium]
GWDNIIIGNMYNFSIWWKQYTVRWNAYNESSANNVLFAQISSTCAMILSLIPVAATFLWLFLTTNNPSKLAALIVTLPRQIQIIQHVEILSTYAMYWHGTYAKLKALISTLILPTDDKNQYIKRIKKREIQFVVNKEPIIFPTIKYFIEMLGNMKNGRITIRGKNGSGKTTLINLIKRELGERAYYLPTNTRLLFESTIGGSFSTGQKMKACFEELKKNLLDDKVLLLDEWDANLDEKNIQIISEMLDVFSKKCCVVEISHRQNIVNSSFNNSWLEETSSETSI